MSKFTPDRFNGSAAEAASGQNRHAGDRVVSLLGLTSTRFNQMRKTGRGIISQILMATGAEPVTDGDRDRTDRELAEDRILSAPVGPQTVGYSPSIFRNDVSQLEVIAGAALGGEIGAENATLERVNAILQGEIPEEELDIMAAERSRLARERWAGL